jgi:membrane protein implicated in regulation of membrane protease activity
MKYALAYVVVYLLSFIVFLLAVLLGWFSIVAVIMFVTWSPPIIFPFSYVVLRILMIIAAVLALAFTSSNEGKDAVEEFVSGYDRARTKL